MPEDNEQHEMVDSEGGAEASEIQFLLHKNEDKILNATIKAFESGSLTPLIKEELRCTIQSRRLAAGKGELLVEEFKKPPKKKPMTEEERKRTQTRRVQNREAAQRFRQRQKDQGTYLTEKIKRLEKSSHNLMGDMKRLKDERDELKKMLQDHLLVCTNNVPIPDLIYPNLERLLHQCTNPSTSSDEFSVATPQCPNTSDSTSSVFFSDDISCTDNEHQTLGSLLQDWEANSIEIKQDTVFVMQELTEAPEMGQEMVIGDEFSDSLSEHSGEHRHDSCSNFDISSNYSSVSSDNYLLVDSTNEFSSTLAATFSMVHNMNQLCSQPFEVTFTDDVLLLNDTTL